MRIRTLEVHKLLGANKIADGADTEVFLSDAPKLRAYVTEKPDEVFRRIDHGSAFAKLILMGFTRPTSEMTAEQALGHELDRLASARKPGGVYVVFDGAAEVEKPDLQHRRAVGDVDVALDAVDKAAVQAQFAPLIGHVLAALKLGQTDRADGQTEHRGTVALLLDGEREIYLLNLEAGAMRASLATPLTLESLRRSAALTKVLAAEDHLERVGRLFVESFKRQTDPLFAFIAAWSALEVFVGTTFKNTYQERWYAMLESSVPSSARPVIKRFEEVMSDKLRLADKFAVIASILDVNQAGTDLATFVRIKKVRDGFFHSPEPGAAILPLDTTQSLLRKYLGLHLSIDLSPD